MGKHWGLVFVLPFRGLNSYCRVHTRNWGFPYFTGREASHGEI